MMISPLLKIEPGITALIGGGGKTTLMYTLAEELLPHGSVILCTSTKIRVPAQYPVLTGGDENEIRNALLRHPAVCVGTPLPEGKLGPAILSFPALSALADYVIAEADGSKTLPLKAHADHEPVIPENARQVILLLGADGLGQPIRKVCHRPELYAKLAGADLETPVSPPLAARVVTAEGLGDRIFINKVEDSGRLRAAREIAQLLHRPVVAGSLHRGVYECLS